MKYKFIDSLTSDVLFEAYGKTLKELFENAALAMFSVICKVDRIEKKDKISIEVAGEDEKNLLYNWLQELIAHVDIEEMFFSGFNITKISKTELKAEIFGEPISKEKGETVVKAVTNYKFNLEKTKKEYKATVSLDI
jgi:SHS2 domain-containing protein